MRPTSEGTRTTRRAWRREVWLVAALAAALGGCASSQEGTSGETHFQICEDTPECEEMLGDGYVCVQEAGDDMSRCHPLFDPNDPGAAGAGGAADSSGAGGGTAGSPSPDGGTAGDGFTAGVGAGSVGTASFGTPCAQDAECEAGLSCLAPARSSVSYCTRLCTTPNTVGDNACAGYDGPGQTVCLLDDPMDPNSDAVCAIQCADFGSFPPLACPDCDDTCPSGLSCTQTMFAGTDPIGGRCSGADAGPLELPAPTSYACAAHFLIDNSGSAAADGSLDILVNGLLQALDTLDVESSLLTLPLELGGALTCDPGDYMTPLSDFGASVEEHGAALAMLSPLMIDSPKAIALEGALEYARTESRPERNSMVIVLTDGTAPTGCPNSSVDQMAFIASDGLSRDPSVRTIVITVGGDGSVDFGPVSIAGGTQAVPQGLPDAEGVAIEIKNALELCDNPTAAP